MKGLKQWKRGHFTVITMVFPAFFIFWGVGRVVVLATHIVAAGKLTYASRQAHFLPHRPDSSLQRNHTGCSHVLLVRRGGGVAATAWVYVNVRAGYEHPSAPPSPPKNNTILPLMQATTFSNQSFAPSPYCPTQATHLHRHNLLLCCGVLDQFRGTRTDKVQGASSMTSLRLPPPTQKLNRASQGSWRGVFLACLLVLHVIHGFVAPVLRHGFLRPFCARTSHRGTGTSPRAQHAMVGT